MSVPGTWTFQYDWGCTGFYNETTITFNSDGTFATGEGPFGIWISHDGQILLQYSNNTSYGGSVADNAMVGISMGTNLNTGCWFALKAATPPTRPAAKHKQKYDASGAPIK